MIKILLSCLLALLILLTGCAPKTASLPPGSKFGFDSWLDIFNQKAENLVEARNHPALIYELGLGSISKSEFETVSLANPGYEARLNNTYLSRHEGIVVIDSWNWEPIPTGVGWTSDRPVTEYHWIEFDNGRISNWQVMYDQALHEAAGSPLDQEILREYASAWSSGVAEAVTNLYTQEAVRHELLLWGSKSGISQLIEFANDFFTEYPNTSIELLHSFGELPEAGLVGGVFAIRVKQLWRTCEIREIVVVKPDNNKIIEEWVFYQGDTLIDCGWVR